MVELQNSGYDVVIVDNLSNSRADVVDSIEQITGIRPAFDKVDCLDQAGLDAVFTKYPGIEGIIHFAASKAVGESVQKPQLYYRNNLVSLINLLELMPKHGVKGNIFSSSCTVYGPPAAPPARVDDGALLAPHGDAREDFERSLEFVDALLDHDLVAVLGLDDGVVKLGEVGDLEGARLRPEGEAREGRVL